MSRFRYTEEHIEYVKSIAEGRYNDEIAELFNKKFGLDKTPSAINSMKGNHGITSGKLPKRRNQSTRLFTKEQENFIRKNAKGLYNDELAALINETFGLNITRQQINTWKSNHGVSSGLTGRFEKGHKTWNKGMTGLQIGGKETQFKPGQVPHNYKPVGSERICTKDGYTLIKVQDDGTYQERWRHKHVVVWEEYHGKKVPDNHVIVFADRNKQNLDIDNLLLISRSELVRMNQKNLFSSDSEVTKTGLNLIKLKNKTVDIEIYDGDREEFQKHVEIAKRNGISESTLIARRQRGWKLQDAVSKPLHYVPHRRKKNERSVSN